jgi:hypothetical protein
MINQVSGDFIDFLRSIPDVRMCRGIRYPQWYLLLVAVLGIMDGCRGSRSLERFAEEHHQELNNALSLNLRRSPTDATFLYLFSKPDLQEFGEHLEAWLRGQASSASENIASLGQQHIEDIRERDSRSHHFVNQVAMLTPALGEVLAKTDDLNDENHKIK